MWKSCYVSWPYLSFHVVFMCLFFCCEHSKGLVQDCVEHEVLLADLSVAGAREGRQMECAWEASIHVK